MEETDSPVELTQTDDILERTGFDRRRVLKGIGVGAILDLGLVGSASAHEVVGNPVFCGCDRLCVCVEGNTDVLMARETEDGYDIGFDVGEGEIDPYPEGKPRYSGSFCVDTADGDIPDGKIIGLQVDGTRWINPNSCAQDALEAEREQLASTHPRPEGESGVFCDVPPCETTAVGPSIGAELSCERLVFTNTLDRTVDFTSTYVAEDAGDVTLLEPGEQLTFGRPGDWEFSATIDTDGTPDSGSDPEGETVSINGRPTPQTVTIEACPDGDLTLRSLPPLLESEPQSVGRGINDGGTVVGGSSTESEFHAVRWPDDDTVEDLGTLRENDDGFSQAYAVSNDGTVVGEAEQALGTDRSFRWTPSSGMEPLGTLTGSADETSRATDVNSTGTIVGTVSTPPGRVQAFRWSESDGMEGLGTLQQDNQGSAAALGITDDETILGWSTTDDGEETAFAWTEAEGMESLEGLGTGQYSEARDANADGVIVGNAHPQGGLLPHAAKWVDGTAIELEMLEPSDSELSGAFGINEAGTIVGFSFADIPADSPNHAVRWVDGDVEDLGSLGGDDESSAARGINEGGTIAGSSGLSRDSGRAAVVWEP